MLSFLKSTVGKKYLMGLSGAVWAGFVFVHMAGNLLIFLGPDAYNKYAHSLASGNLVVAVDTLLLIALIVHVFLAVNLTMENRAARPERYAVRGGREKGATLASRTMAVHGSIILIFVVTHLLTFKFGTVYMTNVNGVEMRDLARLMVEVFQQPLYVAWYVISLVLLFFHLKHGVGSVFQSFGLLHPTYQPMIKKLSLTYALVVSAGFISQPIYVFLIAGSRS